MSLVTISFTLIASSTEHCSLIYTPANCKYVHIQRVKSQTITDTFPSVSLNIYPEFQNIMFSKLKKNGNTAKYSGGWILFYSKWALVETYFGHIKQKLIPGVPYTRFSCISFCWYNFDQSDAAIHIRQQLIPYILDAGSSCISYCSNDLDQSEATKKRQTQNDNSRTEFTACWLWLRPSKKTITTQIKLVWNIQLMQTIITTKLLVFVIN